MADLSLGPLRIANPDDGGSPDTPIQQQPSQQLLPQMPQGGPGPSVSPLPEANGHQDYMSMPRRGSDSPVSPLDTPPDERSLAHTRSNPAAPQSFQHRPSDRPRQQHSLPMTYQDQQQSQFPKYPTMMPQNLHDTRAPPTSSRPASQYYPQNTIPINGSASSNVSRQSSYRMRTDPSAGAIPNRTASKRAGGLGDHAGVPSRDDSHSERQYGPSQYNAASGAMPPRRSSRGMANASRLGTTPTGNTPLSTTPMSINTPLSSSPYNIEGGPLASSEEWQERGAAVSKRTEYDEEGRPHVRSIKKGVKDFNFGQTLGEGSYSTVLAAQDRQTGKDYAIKVLDKRHIIKEKKVKYVNIEKDTLNRLTDHPGVVRLYYTFQDERSLYFVLDLCSGGELLGVLKRMTTFDEECTRFYSAQILDTIEYMHNRGVIHRDLKPENVLLDDNKHIKITDFGTAKLLPEIKDQEGRRIAFDPDSSTAENRASSFVGTAEYVSPELLTDKNACKASDLWAFGCIVYQLLAGRPPFKAGNEYQTFQKIVALEYDFPRGFPEVAKDLVERLLVLEPQRRLTIEHIKNHQFFDGITWGKGLWSQKAPRLKTYIPPPNAPIRLNGGAGLESFPPDINPSHSTQPTMLPPDNQRPQPPRVITELPPPSQLDIEWSPVLTRNNERILKLGNLSVLATPHPHSPEQGGKLSRLFGGGGNGKKRERLVMVTSSGRIIIAPAGGDEKKAKFEIPLLSPNTDYSSSTDAKGITQWVVDTVSLALPCIECRWLTRTRKIAISSSKIPSHRRGSPWQQPFRLRSG
jgi:3-phosphoinositide dependent protein kinase-1